MTGGTSYAHLSSLFRSHMVADESRKGSVIQEMACRSATGPRKTSGQLLPPLSLKRHGQPALAPWTPAARHDGRRTGRTELALRAGQRKRQRGREPHAVPAKEPAAGREPADRKLSKIETLRLASSYISHLANVLLLDEDSRDGQPCLKYHGKLKSPPLRPICTFCLSNQRKTQKDGERHVTA